MSLVGRRRGWQVLELLLAVAILTLIVQLLPWQRWPSFISLADVRQWSSGNWFCANAILFFSMFAVRFRPQLKSLARDATSRIAFRRSAKPDLKSKLSQEEEKALYERMKEARKKQVV